MDIVLQDNAIVESDSDLTVLNSHKGQRGSFHARFREIFSRLRIVIRRIVTCGIVTCGSAPLTENVVEHSLARGQHQGHRQHEHASHEVFE